MAGEFVASVFPSGGGFSDQQIATGANISASKLQQQHLITFEIAEQNTAIVAVERLLGPMPAAGTWKSIEGAIVVQATGGDRTVTVNLHRSTGGGAFGTVLTTTVNITNSTTILVPVAGSFSNTSISDGDIFKVVVTVAGVAGAQAKGLTVALVANMNPLS